MDPSTIRTREDAMNVLQSLRQSGLPDSVLNKVNNYLNNPLAKPILGSLGFSQQDFRNGLQSITRLDQPSALNKNSLLNGIDQLQS